MRILFILALSLFSSVSFSQNALQIYGGKNHDVYLGCLNCNNFNTNSIWNQYGTYGSKYSNKSIWNSYSDYGSQFSNLSPFNTYASYPPVIVDGNGTFYGYFTVNDYKSQRADFKLASIIYKYYDLIRDDVSSWYEKIFN
ncbi:hypothetical protein QEG73_01015 [Chitinophagaceae bacterium 26-R-25]|nr:hypothetical protein [Chitinophagaceae bacterium 26-R-25]